MAYAVGSAPNGGIIYSDGSIKYAGSSSTNSNFANYRPTSSTPINTPYTPPKSSGGDVLGASTSSSGGSKGDSYLDQLAKRDRNPWEEGEYQRLLSEANNDAAARESRIRGTIDSGFNDIFSSLDNLKGAQSGYRAEDEALLGQQFANMQTGVEQGRTAAQDKLALARQGVETRQAQSSTDLAEQLRNMLKASQFQIGAIGAGDSSAAQTMLPYAFSKIGAREGGNLMRQANQQYGEIDQKEIDVRTTYDTEMNNLEQWKVGSLQQIAQTYRETIERIENAKIGAGQQKLQALLQLETGILDQARQKVATLETEARGYQNQINQWATDRIAQLQNYQIEQGRMGQFDPRELAFNAIQGVSGIPQSQGGGVGVGGFGRDEQFRV